MKKYKFNEILISSKKKTKVKNKKTYTQIQLLKNLQGVEKKENLGIDIKQKNQLKVKTNQFLISKLAGKEKRYFMIHKAIKNGIVTKDILVYDINEKLIDIKFFYLYMHTKEFFKIIKSISKRGRGSFKEKDFENATIKLPNIRKQGNLIKLLKSNYLTDTNFL